MTIIARDWWGLALDELSEERLGCCRKLIAARMLENEIIESLRDAS